VLLQHDSVKEASVLAHQTGRAAFLVAYVACHAATSDAALKRHLFQSLPEYMVPSVYIFLDGMPLAANGKIDRRALPPPDRAPEAAYVGPRDPIEQMLVSIWMDALGLDRIGVNDDFFELGGHSLLAVHVVSRIRSSLGVDLSLARLFDSPTIAGVAVEIRDAQARTAVRS
jgi:nonribosomal peptide synthetase DhbF